MKMSLQMHHGTVQSVRLFFGRHVFVLGVLRMAADHGQRFTLREELSALPVLYQTHPGQGD